MKEWKREAEKAYSLLKRVVRRALLEVLSRLNGAMEGNIESITSVFPTLCCFLSSFFLTCLISHPLCLFSSWVPTIFSISNQKVNAPQLIKLTVIFVAVADLRTVALGEKMSSIMAILPTKWNHLHEPSLFLYLFFSVSVITSSDSFACMDCVCIHFVHCPKKHYWI